MFTSSPPLGPFSLAQIRAQIQRGEIVGEHMIVDSDTGARKKVKDFPLLRDFARNSERQIEQNRRAHAEIRHEKSEKVKRILELNPSHSLIPKLKAIFLEDKADPRLKMYAALLLGQAHLAESGQLPDPAAFSKALADIMLRAV